MICHVQVPASRQPLSTTHCGHQTQPGRGPWRHPPASSVNPAGPAPQPSEALLHDDASWMRAKAKAAPGCTRADHVVCAALRARTSLLALAARACVRACVRGWSERRRSLAGLSGRVGCCTWVDAICMAWLERHDAFSAYAGLVIGIKRLCKTVNAGGGLQRAVGMKKGLRAAEGSGSEPSMNIDHPVVGPRCQELIRHIKVPWSDAALEGWGRLSAPSPASAPGQARPASSLCRSLYLLGQLVDARQALGELHVLGHQRHAAGVDGSQVGALQQRDQKRLGRLLQRQQRVGAEAQPLQEGGSQPHVLGQLAHQALEGRAADEQLRGALVLLDLSAGGR